MLLITLLAFKKDPYLREQFSHEKLKKEIDYLAALLGHLSSSQVLPLSFYQEVPTFLEESARELSVTTVVDKLKISL